MIDTKMPHEFCCQRIEIILNHIQQETELKESINKLRFEKEKLLSEIKVLKSSITHEPINNNEEIQSILEENQLLKKKIEKLKIQNIALTEKYERLQSSTPSQKPDPEIRQVIGDALVSGKLNENDNTYNIVKSNKDLAVYETGYYVELKSLPAQIIREEYKVLSNLNYNHPSYDTAEIRMEFNRYSDIFPYKYNSVKINQENHGHDFINASYCSSSLISDEKLIVCQAPLKTTIEDFWGMCYEQKVNLIIMLCKFKAGSRDQSSEYFPQNKDPITTGKGLYKISLVNEEDLGNQILKKEFSLLNIKDNQTKSLVHYQWLGWPDHGVPKSDDFGCLFVILKEMLKLQTSAECKILTHCSAGVGRSGTIMALYNLCLILQEAKKKGLNKNFRVSIFSVVRRLREERCLMVQTVEQYELVYKIFGHILDSPDLVGL